MDGCGHASADLSASEKVAIWKSAPGRYGKASPDRMIFFLDESGHDKKQSPYDVRAAIGVPQSNLWKLIQRMNRLEEKHFGLSLHSVDVELKGKKCLASKRLEISMQCALLETEYRRGIVRGMLQKQAIARIRKEDSKPAGHELAAYAQACSAFVIESLEAAIQCGCKGFAALVNRKADTRLCDPQFLRKDYRRLLDRFSWFLKEHPDDTGILVFDETERRASRRLLCQLERYANETERGYEIASTGLVLSPFFVQSDLTPVVQLADFLAYIVNWSIRFGRAREPVRKDLSKFASLARRLEWKGIVPDAFGNTWAQYGYCYLDTLEDGKKRGSDTQSLPASSGQGQPIGLPESAGGQLSLFDFESTTGITKPIKESRFDDWFQAEDGD